MLISDSLGTEALAAVGYYAPLSVLSGLVSVIILGAVVPCGNLMGSGQSDKVNSMFNSSFITILVVCSLISVILIVIRNPLSFILGARGDTQQMLADYILGYAPCIALSSLSSLLVSLAAYINETNRTYIAAAALLLGDIAFNAILVKPLGILGIGLASTISGLLSLLVMLPAYMKKEDVMHLAVLPFDLSLVLLAARRGLPSLLFTGGLLIKNSLINYSLTVYIDYEAIAVANVLASVCGIAGTLSGGCTNAFSSLSSLYFGEEDREAQSNLFHTAMCIGLLVTSILVAAMFIFSKPLSGVFFDPGTRSWQLGQDMFRLGFLFIPINLIINILLYSYKAQDRMLLVNVMSFAEVAMVGVLAALTVTNFGVNAVWLANTWSDLLALVIILVSVFLWKKKPSLKTQDLMKIPDDFGAKADEYVEYAVSTPMDVSMISQSVIAFCE